MSENPETVFAIHDFEREHEDEINFYAGEPIQVLEKDEKYLDGWWQGRNPRGQVGLFPMNYTSPTRLTHLSVISQSLDQQNIPNQQKIDDHDVVDPALNTTITTASSIKSSATTNSSHSTNVTPPELSSSSYNHKPPSDQAPELWDVPRVCAWLESVGLASAVDNFIEQEITGDVLLDLNMDTLKELGIAAYGRRYKIMTAINKLIATQGPAANKANTNEAMNQKPLNTVKGPVPKVSISSGHSPSENILQQESRYAPSVTSSISSSTGGDVLPSSARHPRSTLSSSVDADSLYQFPRKAPAPPSSSTSSSSDGNHITHRPISSTSQGSSPSNNVNISRSNTFNTTSSNTGTIKSYDHSTTSAFRSQKELPNEDAVHPTPSFSTPTKATNLYTSGHDFLQHEMSTRINHPADQKLSMASIDSAVQRFSTDEFQAPEHEGWLHKQGDRYKTWNKRWFVLKGTNLFYFKSPKDVRMKGIINLRGYRMIVDEAIHSNKYCFKAQHEHERTFFFYTDTKENMKLWLQALMKATIMRDFTSPVMSSNQVATVPLDVAQRMRPRPPSVIMYKPPPLPPTNEPMQRVIEEEEPHYGSSQQSLDEDTHYTTTTATDKEMDAPTTFNNSKISDSDENDADSDEDNIDPYQTAQQQNQLQMESLSKVDSNTMKRSSTTNERTSTSENGWSNAQYVDWINQYLPQGKKVVDLSSAFRNGDTLIVLLETLSNKTVRRNPDQKGGSVSMKVLDNIVAAFKFMGKEGVVVDGRYTIKDIFGGHEDKILDMVDAIKLWADTNGYTDEHYTTEPPSIGVATANLSKDPSDALSLSLLPETPADQDDFSKSFYRDTMQHMADSTHNPQHVS